jgi:hypothetical protein
MVSFDRKRHALRLVRQVPDGRDARCLHLLALLLCLVLTASAPAAGTAAEIVLDFETAPIGKPATSWTEQDVVFTLAHEPRQSKAPGRVTFFPHLATQRKGILCAMATEPIPVRATFPRAVTAVTVVLWGSTGCAALLEAFDASGSLVATTALPVVPARTSPGDPVPFCELTVRAPAIAHVQFSGPRPGEFLAADEVRYVALAPASTASSE